MSERLSLPAPSGGRSRPCAPATPEGSVQGPTRSQPSAAIPIRRHADDPEPHEHRRPACPSGEQHACKPPSGRERRGGAFRGPREGAPLPPPASCSSSSLLSRKLAHVRNSESGPAGRWTIAIASPPREASARYRFRVRIPREAGYPYEAGESQSVGVTVSGPMSRDFRHAAAFHRSTFRRRLIVLDRMRGQVELRERDGDDRGVRLARRDVLRGAHASARTASARVRSGPARSALLNSVAVPSRPERSGTAPCGRRICPSHESRPKGPAWTGRTGRGERRRPARRDELRR